MKTWIELSDMEKRHRVVNLAIERTKAADEAKMARRTRNKRSSTKQQTKLTFKSKELEQLFYSMPKDMQKKLFG